MEKGEFLNKLRLLHFVGNELSLSRSVNGLCRDMVRLGRGRLGFDRISTWFIDKSGRYLIGSFGVDEKGRIREEVGERVRISGDPVMKKIHTAKKHSLLMHGVSLCGKSGNVVGRGSHIAAAIWTGKKIIGYISTDNLIRRERFTDHDRELLELFASTFGHLYSLKKAEEEIRAAYGRLKDAQSQLVQAAKMEVIGSLASGVAHEVKNPLAIILQGIDFLSTKITRADERGHDAVRRIKNSVMRADDIIKGLLDFSALSRGDFMPQDINSIIEKSLRLISYEIDKCNISVSRHLEKKIPDVKIDKNKIEQVLVNVFLNSINHMPSGGNISIKTYLKITSRSRHLIVEIEDTGPGIPPENLSKIFNPFFTTRRANGGTGLGLAIARNIMGMHKGRINITNRTDGHGARATLVFKA